MDAPAIGDAANGSGVLHAHGKGLLHHYVNAAGRACFDDHRVVVRAGERGDGFGFRAVQHNREVVEESRSREAVAFREFPLQFNTGLKDPDDLRFVLVTLHQTHEPADMPVNESDDGEPQTIVVSGARRRRDSPEQQENASKRKRPKPCAHPVLLSRA